jgi:hypothetical protein
MTGFASLIIFVEPLNPYPSHTDREDIDSSLRILYIFDFLKQPKRHR